MKQQQFPYKPHSSLFQAVFVLLLPLTTLLWSACTSIAPEAIDVQLEYREKIVISGVMSAGDTIQNIQISRTLPPLEDPIDENTAITNATVHLTVNSRIYTMELQPPVRTTGIVPERIDKRSFFRVRGLIAEAGKEYTIVVRWKNLKAEATTRVPLVPPNIDSTRFAIELRGDIGVRLVNAYASFMPRENEVFRMIAQLRRKKPRTPFEPLYFVSGQSDIGRWQDRDSMGVLTLKIPSLGINQQDLDNFDSLYTADILFYAYDKAYYDYEKSITRRTNDIVFNVPLTNPKWNVNGDGIGLFVGVATSRTPLKKM
jgi:hypothetical protein